MSVAGDVAKLAGNIVGSGTRTSSKSGEFGRGLLQVGLVFGGVLAGAWLISLIGGAQRRS